MDVQVCGYAGVQMSRCVNEKLVFGHNNILGS